ncbi:hypothetical protein FMUBM48_07670 [Nocardia cyriacigeorgica]|nr:hypothetical protein FMUBM48_07670 [Nocardia cyriacigeorgica]
MPPLEGGLGVVGRVVNSDPDPGGLQPREHLVALVDAHDQVERHRVVDVDEVHPLRVVVHDDGRRRYQ